MKDLFQQFYNLFDPSATLGAFLISVSASFFSGFFTAKKVSNNQKAKTIMGDMIQDSKVVKR